jgi:peptidyl-prolyl cis-trans isomerase B (cyclophilin B)
MENGNKITVELYPNVAPITVENFKRLVSEDFYSGIIFHRVIAGFMVQGGDPTATGMGGSKQTIKGEFASNGVKNEISHVRGVISMARSQNKNSASSQFFIMHADGKFLDGEYAAFGKVVSGIEVVDEIAGVKTDFRDRPIIDMRMKSVTLVEE